MDGLYQRRSSSAISLPSPPIESRLNNTSISMDDQSDETYQSKKKKVRWADVEENVLHLHKKAGLNFFSLEVFYLIFVF